MKSPEILDSWKAIANYLERDKKTCYRWEKRLGLPVHRIDESSSRSKVFAFKAEIDQWLKDKAGENELPKTPFVPWKKALLIMFWGMIILASCLVLLFTVVLPPSSSQEPPSNSQEYPPAFEEADSLGPLMEPGVFDPAAVLERFEHLSDPWELYHRGEHFLAKQIRSSNELAMALFLRATRIDEDFWPALVGLAQGYAHMVRHGWDPFETRLDRAAQLLERAASLSPRAPDYFNVLADTLLLRYMLFDGGTRDQAYQVIQAGLEKSPNHPGLNARLGEFYYLSFGEHGKEADFQDALKYLEKSFWLSPYSLDNVMYAELLLLNRDFTRSLEVCGQLKNIDPSRRSELFLGVILYYSGELEKSRIIFDRFEIPLEFKTEALFFLGMIAAQRGDEEEARQVLQRLDVLVPSENQSGDQALKRASIRFGLGDGERGQALLRSRFSGPGRDPFRYIHARYVVMDRNFSRALEGGRLEGILPFNQD
jgi:tetratricopeptide (TPR) repeat protein